MPNRRAITALAAGAALVTIALTGAAFWLSYEHLHDVAGGHGLTGSRAWAWPGTVDLFIVAGELLTLRASLLHRVDWWAIALAALGSGGSSALNVFGVGGSASALNYVVAAVPSTAALVAFGGLMRQVHQALNRRADAADAPAPDAFERVASEATALATPAPGPGALVFDLAPMLPPHPDVTADAHLARPAANAGALAPVATAANASDEELIEQARALRRHRDDSARPRRDAHPRAVARPHRRRTSTAPGPRAGLARRHRRRRPGRPGPGARAPPGEGGH